MGIASFLGGRKAAGGGGSSADDPLGFKAQAYATTTASLPPVLGQGPVSGNGVTAIGSNGIHILPRPRSKPRLPHARSSTSLRPTATASPTPSLSSAAPSPLVPRLRSSTLGRPNTAPDDPNAAPSASSTTQTRPKSSGKTRSRRNSLRQSVALLRRSGSQGDIRASDGGSIHDIDAPPVPAIPAAHSASPGADSIYRLARHGASSTLTLSTRFSGSVAGGSGHVDLLDASGEIRPADFRSRIKATGARDYGEDVAERNMRQTNAASDPAGPTTSAYYATATRSIERDMARASPDMDSLDRRPRTVNYPQRVDSHTPIRDEFTLDEQPPWQDTRSRKTPAVSPDAPNKSHRHTEHTHVSSHGSSSRHNTSGGRAKHKPTPLQLHPIQPTVSSSSESAADPPIIHKYRPLVTGLGISNSLEKDLPPPPQDPYYPGSTSRRSSRSRQKSTSSAAPAPSIPTFRPSDYPQIHMSRIDSVRGKNQRGRSGARSTLARPKSSSGAFGGPTYPRTRSLGGTSTMPGLSTTLNDITEHIPPRSSSRRNWSVSSSATGGAQSTYSSDLQHRPHSRHTAETSIPTAGSVQSLSLMGLGPELTGRGKERARNRSESSATYQSPEHTIDAEGNIYYTAHHSRPSSSSRPLAQKTRSRSSTVHSVTKAKQQQHQNPDQPRKRQTKQSSSGWSPQDEEFGAHRLRRVPSNESTSSRNYSNDNKIHHQSSSGSSPSETALLFRDEGYGYQHGTLPGLFSTGTISTLAGPDPSQSQRGHTRSHSPTPSELSMQTMTYDQDADLDADSSVSPGGLRPPSTPSHTLTSFPVPDIATSSPVTSHYHSNSNRSNHHPLPLSHHSKHAQKQNQTRSHSQKPKPAIIRTKDRVFIPFESSSEDGGDDDSSSSVGGVEAFAYEQGRRDAETPLSHDAGRGEAAMSTMRARREMKRRNLDGRYGMQRADVQAAAGDGRSGYGAGARSQRT